MRRITPSTPQIQKLHQDKKEDKTYERRSLGEFDDKDGHYSVRRTSHAPARHAPTRSVHAATGVLCRPDGRYMQARR